MKRDALIDIVNEQIEMFDDMYEKAKESGVISSELWWITYLTEQLRQFRDTMLVNKMFEKDKENV